MFFLPFGLVSKPAWIKFWIPHSHSLVFWRLSLAKFPTDGKVTVRGLHFPSRCIFCLKEEETLNHLFFSCAYAYNVWNWLQQMLGYNSLIGCLDDCFLVMNKTAYAKCRLVDIASVVSTIQAIWHAHNRARFQNVSIHWKSYCSSIISMILMAGNLCKLSSSASTSEFVIMKNFSITIHPPIPKCLKEVLWCLPQ